MDKNLLDIYSDYLIIQNGYATETGLLQILDGQISHEKITRFLNGKEASSREFWEYVNITRGVLILENCASFQENH